MFEYHYIESFNESDVALYDKIYKVTDSINQYYPNHCKWFYEKFLEGLKSKERIIVYATDKNNNVVGVSLIKKTDDENKMCCFFVKEEYQKNGIGSVLMEESLNIFEGKKPLMTVSEVNLPKLEKILKKYGFELIEAKTGEYLDGEKEFYFN